MVEYTPVFLARFWSRVDKNGPIPPHCPELGPCWVWTAGATNRNYGAIYSQGKQRPAHRVSWAIANGLIPDGSWVLHKCDNPRCVNPDHLFLGTHQDNVLDRDRKGRVTHGEAHYCSKLSDEQVVEIRRRYAAGGVSQRALAAEYGVDQTTIYYHIHQA